MQKLTIHNVLSHGDATFDFEKGATLVTGANSSGKTSLARILAAITTHTTNPAGLSATAAKAYIKRGETEAYAELEGVGRWLVHDQKIEYEASDTPEANDGSVGLIDFVKPRTKLEDRMATFESLFEPPDAEELLKAAWGGVDATDDRKYKTALETVKQDGWESAAGTFDELKREAGRNWRKLSGEVYSKKRAANWRPDNWRNELEGVSEDDMMQALTNCNEALRAMQVQDAITSDQIERGIHARDVEIPELEQEAEIIKTAMETREKGMAELKGLVVEDDAKIRKLTQDIGKCMSRIKEVNNKIGDFDQGAPLKCPECGTDLQLVNDRLELWNKPDEADLKELQDGRAKLNDYLEKKKDAVNEVEEERQGKLATIKLRMTDQKEDYEQYNKLIGSIEQLGKVAKLADQEEKESNESERSALEAAREEAARDLEAYRKNQQAKVEHNNYIEYERIAKILGPSGARKRWQDEKMKLVRSCLANITKKTGWKTIAVNDAYELTSGGIPVSLVAENERRKAQWAMQITTAMLRKCFWVVIDAADLLRGDSWDGLVSVVNALCNKRTEISVIVCATETECPKGWNEITL